VRQLLYGRGRNAYRILFTIFAAATDEPATVRILHVRHAAQPAIGETEDQDAN
jgi:hypothetical protein